MNIVDTVVKLSRSLTKEQNGMLDLVAQECKRSGQLTPLLAVILHSDRKPSEKTMKIAEELAKRI